MRLHRMLHARHCFGLVPHAGRHFPSAMSLLGIGLAVSAAACAPSEKANEPTAEEAGGEYNAAQQATVSAASPSRPTRLAGPCQTLQSEGSCRAYDAKKYALSAKIDWSAQQLLASEDITLSLNNSNQRIIDLDSTVTVSRVHCKGTELPYVVDAANGTLRVDLALAKRGERTLTFTVDYRANAGGGFKIPAISPIDPVQSRVAFTFSEPDSGKDWLIGNHNPADRAAFSVEFALAGQDDLLANGERMRDEACGRRRCVKYQMNAPTPTYLMAFALGDVVRVDRPQHNPPLSIWSRRGFPLDTKSLFREMERELAAFTRLLGPYPWQQYSIVLLPGFPGGEEHTTASFVSEGFAATPDWFVFAHELAHQWFGDWVTNQSFDDVWIKEGMATLLENEAFRDNLDETNTGSLLGSNNSFLPSDAIRDLTLQGLEKYTSGPYSRGAWLLTQIRAKIGEGAFWAALRRVLREHALGAIDSETFIRSFAPALDAESVEAAIHSLDLHTSFELNYSVEPTPSGQQVSVFLDDPDRSMFVPHQVTVIDAAGRAQITTVTPGELLTLQVPAGGYIAPDERGIHPNSLNEELSDLVLPTSQRALRAFGRRSPSHQNAALWLATNFPSQPQPALTLYRELDSADARLAAERQICRSIQALPPDAPRTEWIRAFASSFQTPHQALGDRSYGPCGVEFARHAFEQEFVTISSRVTAQNLSRLIYIMNYDYGSTLTFNTLSAVARHPINLIARYYAIDRMLSQAVNPESYTPIAPAEYPPWKTFFREQLAIEIEPQLAEREGIALAALQDEQAPPLIAQALLRVKLNSRAQRRLICSAYKASTGYPQTWADFQTALQPWTQFSASAQEALANPSVCR